MYAIRSYYAIVVDYRQNIVVVKIGQALHGGYLDPGVTVGERLNF